MNPNDQQPIMDEVWVQMCSADGLDPAKRFGAREAILNHADAQDCTVYRPDENDPDAEEEDLGDARILFTGPFQAPDDWDEEELAEFFGDDDPELFVTALIECEAKPASARFFAPDLGDYVAVMAGPGEVQMYYVCDYNEDDNGRQCILIRDDQPLD